MKKTHTEKSTLKLIKAKTLSSKLTYYLVHHLQSVLNAAAHLVYEISVVLVHNFFNFSSYSVSK